MRHVLPLLLATMLSAFGCVPAVIEDPVTEPIVEAEADLNVAASFEGEQMLLPAGGKIYSDSSASAGQAVTLWNAGAASATLSLSSPVNQLTIRAKGDQCNGAPRMEVRVDGALLLTADVVATSWTDYTVRASLAAGSHRVELNFPNDYYAGTGCDRNLRLDKGTFFVEAVLPPEPPPAASLVAAAEAESFSVPAAGKIVSDSAASGGKAVIFYKSGTATRAVTLSAPVGQLTVRAKSDLCSGGARMEVRIDNALVVNVTVPANTWTDYNANVSLAAGSHAVSVSFPNDYYGGSGCDRNLRLDKLSFFSNECVAETCAELGKNCGTVDDGCGRLIDCGSCGAPETCGGTGTPNVCGQPLCQPKSCAELGKNCGTVSNGCGGTLSCGSCTAPQTCGGAGVANVCGGGATCTPTTCAAQGKNCGTISDGCGGTLSCGSCTAPQSCGGAGVANVCGGGATTPSTSSVTVMVAGDVQNGSWGTSTNWEKTAQVLDAHSGAFDYILGLGDMSNAAGTSSDYQNFHRGWGRHLGKILAIPGSHDGYGSGGADIGGGAFFDYFNGPGSSAGLPSAGTHTGPRGKGYFAMDIGGWLLIGLNYCATSNHVFTAGDAQMAWLADVMRNKPAGKPVIVIQHTPRYTKASGHTENGAKASVAWDILMQYKPDVKLFMVGHMNGIYERFVPMNNARQYDPQGIRSFTVGTGGCCSYSPGSTDSLLEKSASTFGVLKMVLKSNGYEWQFLPSAGYSFTDSGSVSF